MGVVPLRDTEFVSACAKDVTRSWIGFCNNGDGSDLPNKAKADDHQSPVLACFMTCFMIERVSRFLLTTEGSLHRGLCSSVMLLSVPFPILSSGLLPPLAALC